MQRIALVFAATLMASAAAASAPAGLEQLAFLEGCWQSERDGRFSEECWTAPRGPLLLGSNRSVRGERASFEFLRIQREDDGRIVYWASPGGKTPVPFALREVAGHRIVFENAGHDYPQRIVYQRQGDTLSAETSLLDGSEPQRWEWKRAGCR